MAGWNADTAAGPMGAGAVTLVEGSSFCIAMANGDIHREHSHGLFVRDARILSGWSLTINGQALEPLTAETKEPYRAVFVGRVPRSDGYADSPLIVERLREVGAGMQEQVTVRNYSMEPADCVLALDDMGVGGAPVEGPLLKAIFAAPDPGAPCSIGRA